MVHSLGPIQCTMKPVFGEIGLTFLLKTNKSTTEKIKKTNLFFHKMWKHPVTVQVNR